jgi:CHAD domain-containing protein
VDWQMMRSDSIRPSGWREAVSTRARLDCATAFEIIALDCVAKVKAYHGGACAGDTEAVHQIRVAITRLRAAVSFFASITADAEWRRLKKEIAWLNTSLSAARDSDVVVEYAHRKRYRAWAHDTAPQYLDAHQTRDRRRLSRCLHSMRFQDLVEAMSSWIERGPWRLRWERDNRRKPKKPLKAYSRRQLNCWRRRLINKGRQLETLGASRRHRLRIRAKRFRYMLEALTNTVPVFGRDEFRHVHGPARRLQRALGDLRDLKRFAKLGRPAKGGGTGKKRPPGYRRRRKKLLGAAVATHRDLDSAGKC